MKAPLRVRDLEKKCFLGESTARFTERPRSSCTPETRSLDSISGSHTPTVRGARWVCPHTSAGSPACLASLHPSSSTLPSTTFPAKWAVLPNMTLTHATAGGKSKIDWAHVKGISIESFFFFFPALKDVWKIHLRTFKKFFIHKDCWRISQSFSLADLWEGMNAKFIIFPSPIPELGED